MRTARLIAVLLLAGCGGQTGEVPPDLAVRELDVFPGHYTATHWTNELPFAEIVKSGDIYAFRGTALDDIRFRRVDDRTLESDSSYVHRIHLVKSGPDKAVLRVQFCYMDVELIRPPAHLALG